MPPKAKYTKEQIVEVAYQMVRQQGKDSLTARGIAAALETSTAPIFTVFHSIDELQQCVFEKAAERYRAYIQEGLSQPMGFKGSGLKYIQFAKDEPELFKLLCMQEDSRGVTHFLPEREPHTPQILQTITDNYGLQSEQARQLYNHLSIYTHGLAVLYANKQCIFTMEDVSRLLSQLYRALRKEIDDENNH